MAIMESPSPLSERWEPAMSNNILNPLEKELLIRLYRINPDIKLSDFCRANNVSEAAFKTWLKKYGAEGLSGLYRSKKTPSLLPEGVDETEETLRRELIKTRIELERLKKGYTRIPREDGTPGEFVPVSEKSARSSRRSRRSSL